MYNTDVSKGLACYVNSDFSGGQSRELSDDANNVIYRTAVIIMYANCPVYWHSLLQTQIALSTATVEYIALSSALR